MCCNALMLMVLRFAVRTFANVDRNVASLSTNRNETPVYKFVQSVNSNISSKHASYSKCSFC